MAPILMKDDNCFAPITPSKTLNCALNCADDSGITFTELIGGELLGGGLNFGSEAFPLCKLRVKGCYCLTISNENDVVVAANQFGDVAGKFQVLGDDIAAAADQTGDVAGKFQVLGDDIAAAADQTGDVAGKFQVSSDDIAAAVNQPDVILVSKDEEVMVPTQKSKKRKVGPVLNKKPGEKRQRKYYWAKIDTPKARTATPKTPKVVTPKPPRPKIPKPPNPKTPKVIPLKPRRSYAKRKPTSNSMISEHVDAEPIKDTTCKRSLTFEDATRTDLEFGSGLIKSWGNVSDEVVPNNFQIIMNDTTCLQGLNPSDGDIAVGDGVKRNKTIKEKNLKVYRRRFNSKCLLECRKLALNFQQSFRKKRLQRKKLSLKALQRLKGFSRSCVVGNSLKQIFNAKGKRGMILPTQEDISQDFNKCVLSLLFSRANFRKKKRLPRVRRFARRFVNKEEPIPSVACVSSPAREPSARGQLPNSNVDLPEYEAQVCTKEISVHIEQIPHESDAQAIVLFTPKKTAVKNPRVVKEKKSRRPYKLKGKKQEDYLCKLQGSEPEPVANVVDAFALDFGKLNVNDDPKTWLVVVDDQYDKADDIYAKIKMKEERENLFQKMGKFIQMMYYYQGSKKFVKWNGSVLDSVVGVFLTQNVSDILSSNAYMKLASLYPIDPPTNSNSAVDQEFELVSSQEVLVEHPDDEEDSTPDPAEEDEPMLEEDDEKKTVEQYDAALSEMLSALPDLIDSKKKGKKSEGASAIDWEKIRAKFLRKIPRTPEDQDSVDWDAVRKAPVGDIAEAIKQRGQHRIIAKKIQQALNRLVEDHGSLDLEWLRNAPPEVAKTYLLSFYGLGLKSVECLRLLTLHHHGFPVDVNIGRISIRLGWVPIKPLPPGMPFHLLEKYPLEDEIQKYLWPRLCHLKQETLYHLHYQMITFGKVFCQKRSPNCRACPFKADCKYYASLSESQRLALPGPGQKKSKSKKGEKVPNPFDRVIERPRSLLWLSSRVSTCTEICVSSTIVSQSSQPLTTFGNVSQTPEFFVEVPSSPQMEVEEVEGDVPEHVDLVDIEDSCDGYMYHLNISTEKNRQTSSDCCLESDTSNKNLGSRELVSVPTNVANNPLPKQVTVSRLRTEHQVYELPRDNPLLAHLNLEMQIGEVPYFLAIWTPDQVEKQCDNPEECPSTSESMCACRKDSSTVPGTLLLPVQTVLRRYFPLNGTYFQTNEVFADLETSIRPINVPRDWIWNLKKRTLYCGSSTAAIAKGSTEMEIRECFRGGFVCTRGFNRKTRSPEFLPNRFRHRRVAKVKSPQVKEDKENII